ncbi:MAG: class I SAM-dependent methyltransferase [Gemmatimonadaceae bacterium]
MTAEARRAAASDRSHQPPAPRRTEQAAARRAAASDRSHQPPARSAGGWWASYFDASYLTEFAPIFDLVQDRREVARLLELLALPSGARILDVPCGQGRHAHLLAEAGFDVDGLDYSAPLLAAARRRGRGRTLRYTRGDMRKLPARWTGRFDAVVNLFTSFGFFGDPADDAQVIGEFARVLAPGGTFVYHGGCRDGVMARFLDRDWWQLEDGTMVGQERAFDPLSGILTVETTSAGPSAFPPREHRIRLYTPTRLAELCRDAGLIVEEAYDGWADRALRRTSTEMLLVARKEQVPSRRRRR